MTASHMMGGTCFSAWIGRANPNPNIGLLDGGDMSELITDIAAKLGIPLPEHDHDLLISLNDLQRAAQDATPHLDPAYIWQSVTQIAAKYSHLTAKQMTPDLHLRARLYN